MSYEYNLEEESKDSEYYKGQIFMYEEAHRLAVEAHRLAVEAGEDTADLESKLTELNTLFLDAGGSFD